MKTRIKALLILMFCSFVNSPLSFAAEKTSSKKIPYIDAGLKAYNQAVAFQIAGKDVEARQKYEEAVKLEPRLSESYAHIASTYRDVNSDLEEKWLKTFIANDRSQQKNSVYFLSMGRLGQLSLAKGDRPAAIHFFKLALDLDMFRYTKMTSSEYAEYEYQYKKLLKGKPNPSAH